jgi:hypothetical protein
MKYAYTIHPPTSISWSDGFRLTLNIAVLAAVYVFLGSLVSFVFYYLFDIYEPYHDVGLEWEDKSVTYKVSELIVQIMSIAVITFWTSIVINEMFPIIPIQAQFARLLDTYATGLFFIYAVFIFVDSLDEKVKFMFHEYIAPYYEKVFPKYGSIVDLSLSYTPPPKVKHLSDRKKRGSSVGGFT